MMNFVFQMMNFVFQMKEFPENHPRNYFSGGYGRNGI